ncbi:MAG: thiamine phosphate synthase [Bacteroidales bacterium]|nr:thiamine phosphate synthase [Bacteroidales bacterium]
MKLIAITNERLFDHEKEGIKVLFETGLERLHLRKPFVSADALKQCISSIPEQYHRRIVLHDHFELAKHFKIGGIHLNSRSTSVPENWKGVCSRSCHSLKEIEQYNGFSYYFLSPIFDSISKNGYKSAFGSKELKTACKEGIISSKVYALGGVTAENLSIVRDFGFGGVAVIGALWGNFENDKNMDLLIYRYNLLKSNL